MLRRAPLRLMCRTVGLIWPGATCRSSVVSDNGSCGSTSLMPSMGSRRFCLGALLLLSAPYQHFLLLSLFDYPAKRCTLWSNLFFDELLEQLIGQSSHELLAICVRVWPMDHTRCMSLQLLGIGLYAHLGVVFRPPECKVGFLDDRISYELVV